MEISIPTNQLLTVIIIILIIVIAILMVLPDRNCPKPIIIERSTKNPLDIQFSSDNFPSNVHNEMFVKSTPWIGGYGIGIGKTYIRKDQENK